MSKIVAGTDNTIALLNEVAEFLEGQADVRDGSDGPRPNKAMELMARAEIEIERLKRASLSGPSEQDRKDAERYRVWRKEGVEYVWNARIREFAGDELDELTDKLIADRAFDPDYYDLT
jgi:hypothetical protein